MRRSELIIGFVLAVVAVGLCVGASNRGVWLALLWPAISFATVAVGYLWGSPALFGKRSEGTRSVWASVVLLPYSATVHLVWRLLIAITREAPFHIVNDRLIVARRLFGHELPGGVSIVLDLTCEMCDPAAIRSLPGYRCWPILDGGALPAQDLVEKLRPIVPVAGTRLLIHCAQGHGRTGMVASAWLILHGYARTGEEAIGILRSVRHRVRLTPEQRIALNQVQAQMRESSS